LYRTLLTETLEIIKKHGFKAELFRRYEASPEVIKTSFTFSADDDCTLVWYVTIEEDEIHLYDGAWGLAQSWSMCSPKCFTCLVEELDYLEYLRGSLEVFYPKAKAEGLIRAEKGSVKFRNTTDIKWV
jgi:hypothetical protein